MFLIVSRSTAIASGGTAANAESDSVLRRIARRTTRGLAMGACERTKDVEYLKLIASYRPARQ